MTGHSETTLSTTNDEIINTVCREVSDLKRQLSLQQNQISTLQEQVQLLLKLTGQGLINPSTPTPQTAPEQPKFTSEDTNAESAETCHSEKILPEKQNCMNPRSPPLQHEQCVPFASSLSSGAPHTPLNPGLYVDCRSLSASSSVIPMETSTPTAQPLAPLQHTLSSTSVNNNAKPSLHSSQSTHTEVPVVAASPLTLHTPLSTAGSTTTSKLHPYSAAPLSNNNPLMFHRSNLSNSRLLQPELQSTPQEPQQNTVASVLSTNPLSTSLSAQLGRMREVANEDDEFPALVSSASMLGMFVQSRGASNTIASPNVHPVIRARTNTHHPGGFTSGNINNTYTQSQIPQQHEGVLSLSALSSSTTSPLQNLRSPPSFHFDQKQVLPQQSLGRGTATPNTQAIHLQTKNINPLTSSTPSIQTDITQIADQQLPPPPPPLSPCSSTRPSSPPPFTPSSSSSGKQPPPLPPGIKVNRSVSVNMIEDEHLPPPPPPPLEVSTPTSNADVPLPPPLPPLTPTNPTNKTISTTFDPSAMKTKQLQSTMKPSSKKF